MSRPLERGGEPDVAQLYALLAGICAAVEGEVVVPENALLAASGRSLHIWKDPDTRSIKLKLADDVPTAAGLPAGYEAWEDTFVGGVPRDLDLGG